jgi:hypothetical protein
LPYCLTEAALKLLQPAPLYPPPRWVVRDVLFRERDSLGTHHSLPVTGVGPWRGFIPANKRSCNRDGTPHGYQKGSQRDDGGKFHRPNRFRTWLRGSKEAASFNIILSLIQVNINVGLIKSRKGFTPVAGMGSRRPTNMIEPLTIPSSC